MYNEPIIGPPWKGWVDQQAGITLDPTSFKQIQGFMITKGRLYSSLQLGVFTGPPNGKVILGGRTFQDALGNYHTLILTQDQAYFLNNTNNYLSIGTISPSLPIPYAVEVMLNKAFFVNGATSVQYTDGSSSISVAGNVPGTCFFLGKLASHLLMVNTIEPLPGLGANPNPARVRWSASGNPLDWSVSNTAGFNDISDVEDQLTGYATLGSYGFAFRNNGITVITPTGSAPPFGPVFKFENYSIGPIGVGCSIPYTLATYGNFCAFVGLDDIYYFDGYNPPQRVGGMAKKSIFADLNNRSSNPTGIITGSMGGGIDYLTYWLLIPLQNNTTTKIWKLHYDTQSWTTDLYPYGRAMFLNNIAVV